MPRHEDYASYWISGAWHNMGINSPVSIDHQRNNIQLGSKILIGIPAFFGNNLGSDLSRESALNLGLQVSSRQLDAGFNVIFSPLVMGVWYRGMIWGNTRQDALIGTAGWAYGNMLI